MSATTDALNALDALEATGGPTPPQAPAKAPEKPTSTSMRLAYRLVTSAPLGGFLAWVSGVAAHTGYHVSVPFLPTWLLFMVATLAAGHFTGLIGAVWHHEKGLTAAQLASQVRAAEVFIEQTAPALLKQLGL